ncbi:MAG: hypothetical protein QF830_11340 [Rhodospirillales bacterium]|jgi:hypothetical protein|nr:hypothetical protein [Rhodospirillales bacterium]MDP6884722.1 hypothetical protein [Rhodospirillales bacterium]
MLLRTKVILVVAGIGLVLSTLFFSFWIPSADENSRRVLERHTQGKLMGRATAFAAAQSRIAAWTPIKE